MGKLFDKKLISGAFSRYSFDLKLKAYVNLGGGGWSKKCTKAKKGERG